MLPSYYYGAVLVNVARHRGHRSSFVQLWPTRPSVRHLRCSSRSTTPLRKARVVTHFLQPTTASGDVHRDTCGHYMFTLQEWGTTRTIKTSGDCLAEKEGSNLAGAPYSAQKVTRKGSAFLDSPWSTSALRAESAVCPTVVAEYSGPVCTNPCQSRCRAGQPPRKEKSTVIFATEHPTIRRGWLIFPCVKGRLLDVNECVSRVVSWGNIKLKLLYWECDMQRHR